MNTPGDESREAAREAAQHVVDDVTSYQSSATPDVIAEALDEGLGRADVTVDDAERERLVNAIHDVRYDENDGTPKVHDASVADEQQ